MANNFFKRWSDNKLATHDENKRDESKLNEEKLDDNQQDESLGQEPIADAKDLEAKISESSEAKTDEQLLGGNDHAKQDQSGQLTSDATSEGLESASVANILAEGIKGSVKKQALRKLFLSGEFSEVDRLNDYDHDYKAVKSLSADAASQLRNWLNDAVEDETEAGETDLVEPETANKAVSEQDGTAQQKIATDSPEISEEVDSEEKLHRELEHEAKQDNNENNSMFTGVVDK